MKKRKEHLLRHDFPSITPAAKSRRLDRECDLCSTNTMVTMEEEEEENAMVKQPCVTATEERAIVLYDATATSPFLKSPSSPHFSIVVKADLIPGLKDYLLSWDVAKRDNPDEDEMRREKSSEVSKDCLAVVPWVAFHSPVAMACEEIVPETGQPLEVEEGDMMEMD